MGQPTSSTGTTTDLPVTPAENIRYEPLPPKRPLSEYHVAAIPPIPRDGDR
jgi:hypothetical protein